MPTLCRKPKNHNCSNFKTYLLQGLTSLGAFFSLATIISIFLKALSAGMTQLERVSLIFGKGLTLVLDHALDTYCRLRNGAM